jgi:dephospho-CoA kinase
MKLIGLAGTIASGKSTVADILGRLPSVAIIHTDEIAREVVAPNMPALQLIINAFGHKYLLNAR